MGGKDPNRQPRLGGLRHTPAGWVRLARCEACGHQAPLPVQVLLKHWGETMLVEFALKTLRCSQCGKRDVRHSMVRLCEPGCPRQRG